MIFSRFRKKGSAPRPSDPNSESTDFLTGDPAVDRASLKLLLDTMAEVASTMEFDQLLTGLVDKSIEVTRSERGILLLRDEDSDDPGRVHVAVSRGVGGKTLPTDIHYSTSVANKVLASGEPLASIVQTSQDALNLGQSVYDLKLRAVMCVPLAARGRMSGAIYVDSRAERKEFTARDLAFFAALGQQLAISIENARLYQQSLEAGRLSHEMEIARRIQEQLMTYPQDLPDGLEVGTWFMPCDAASGDAFDVIPRDDGGLSVMIGDVTGHGIGPALIAHSVQAAVRSYFEIIDDPCEVMRRMNLRLVDHIEAGTFMSLFVASLHVDPADENRRCLKYVNAGHSGVYLVKRDCVKTLDTTAPALGMMREAVYDFAPEEILEAGDLLLLCSDGLVEARNESRDILGEDEVFKVLEEYRGKGCAATIEALKARLDLHLDGHALEDDVMLLAVAVNAR